jgi:CheY-like chemotaxis protein
MIPQQPGGAPEPTFQRLRVLVAEDHDAVRGILVAQLSPNFEVVAAVADGEQLVMATEFLRPDVIISDILMPVKDGYSARKELLSRGIDVPFVFVTLMDVLHTSRVAQTVSYLHKSDIAAELTDGVRTAAGGGIYLSQSFRDLWGNP